MEAMYTGDKHALKLLENAINVDYLLKEVFTSCPTTNFGSKSFMLIFLLSFSTVMEDDAIKTRYLLINYM
jgi:hypothetical protein